MTDPVSGPAAGPPALRVCGHRFDAMICVAPLGHDGPHITSNDRFPHGLPAVGAGDARARELADRIAIGNRRHKVSEGCWRVAYELSDEERDTVIAVLRQAAPPLEGRPGAMECCAECQHRADLTCRSPLLKSNGGEGLPVTVSKRSGGIICSGRAHGGCRPWAEYGRAPECLSKEPTA